MFWVSVALVSPMEVLAAEDPGEVVQSLGLGLPGVHLRV